MQCQFKTSASDLRNWNDASVCNKLKGIKWICNLFFVSVTLFDGIATFVGYFNPNSFFVG